MIAAKIMQIDERLDHDNVDDDLRAQLIAAKTHLMKLLK